jgi:RNA polymerase sigma-70 factor (ECF subfamily)
MSGFGKPRQPTDQVESPERAESLELGTVYATYADRVGGWAARLAGPALDPEDLLHEVFLTVREQLPHFRGDAKLSTWLYRITLNVVRDRRRKERRHWLRNLFYGSQQPRIDHKTPYDSAEERQVTSAVYRVLDQLKERERTLLVLFELEGLSGEEIADLLGVKLDTLWVQLHRARAKFRLRLEREYPDLAKSYRRSG